MITSAQPSRAMDRDGMCGGFIVISLYGLGMAEGQVEAKCNLEKYNCYTFA
jgi:hypothetical protein